jgi:peptidoglycan/LPS O-acetylase OafA/YrhL
VKPQVSLFLDAMRFAAAFVVFLHHFTATSLETVLPHIPWGNEAVLLFFVMSGFVIAFVVDTKERDFRQYSLARLGRLYSVVVPALLLTVVLDGIGRAAAPALYGSAPNDHIWLRVLINLVFLQQSWNLTVIPLSNGPFWSLAFELWYYVIFGAWMLLAGRPRAVVVTLACLLAGPRILAMFPVWLTGVAAYRIHRSWSPSRTGGTIAFVLAAAGLVAIVLLGNPLAGVEPKFRELFPDSRVHVGPMQLFLGDTANLAAHLLFGSLFAVLILTVSAVWRGNAPRGRVAGAIRYLAGSTFSVYLFHVPLLFAAIAVFQPDKRSVLELITLGAGVLASCVALSYVGERQLLRYRSAIDFLLTHLEAWTRRRMAGLGWTGHRLRKTKAPI